MNEELQPTSSLHRATHFLWHNPVWLVIYVAILVTIILLLPGFGVVPAFLLSLVVALLCISQGSFVDLGLKPPKHWQRTILHGLGWGVGTALFFMFVGDPLIEKATGQTIDLSQFDSMRGDAGVYLIWLAIGWVVGGFVEEFTFRGTIISRLTEVFGCSTASIAFAVIVAVVPFGLAHLYQGAAGQISTGINGLYSRSCTFGMITISGYRSLHTVSTTQWDCR